MQIATITGPTFEMAESRITLANRLRDGIELRLDLIKQEIDLDKLLILRQKCKGKVIFTLRSRKEGGGYVGSEKKRQEMILKLLSLEPDYFDIEYSAGSDFFQQISENYPKTKLITSYYDFDRTPKNLEFLLDKIGSKFTHVAKICVMANSLADSYRMLRFILQEHGKGKRIIGLCMGEHGWITRKEGIKSGNYLNYTILGQSSASTMGLYFA